jgi:hypothetical protein
MIWRNSARGLPSLIICCWDRQIECDAESGKLHRLVGEARADYKAGKAKKI